MMLSCTAQAEWVSGGESDSVDFFYDPTTIRKDGNLRRVWELHNLKQRSKNGEMSIRYRAEYDCKNERDKWLSVSTHSEPMAGGEVILSYISDRAWQDIAPSTHAEYMLKIVCAK